MESKFKNLKPIIYNKNIYITDPSSDQPRLAEIVKASKKATDFIMVGKCSKGLSIGIIPEGSISTWLLTRGKEMVMPKSEGRGHFFFLSRGFHSL